MSEFIVASMVIAIIFLVRALCRMRTRNGRLIAEIEADAQRWEAEAHQWMGESQRWRTRATQLALENEAWKAGRSEGRADVISIVPVLVAATQSRSTCVCGAAIRRESNGDDDGGQALAAGSAS